MKMIGVIFLATGIYMSLFLKEPHFYMPFSVGMFLILLSFYNSTFGKKIFKNWDTKKNLTYFVLVLVASFLVDRLGMFLGYWTYLYVGIFDNFLKYVFEWVFALSYFMIAFLIGFKYLVKNKIGIILSFIGALVLFIMPIGIFTEYFNHFANSWIVLKMPLTNFKFGNYFLVFQTIG